MLVGFGVVLIFSIVVDDVLEVFVMIVCVFCLICGVNWSGVSCEVYCDVLSRLGGSI